MADVLLQLIFVVVADEGESEVSSIAVERLPVLQHAVVADGFNHFSSWNAIDGVVTIDGAHDRVLEHGFVVLADVLQLCSYEVDKVANSLLVLAYLREIEVDELHERFQILRRSCTCKAVSVVADGELRATLLTGKSLLQVGGHERAQRTL